MTSRISTLDRRQLVLSGSASVALLALLGVPSIGTAQEAQAVENGWEEALAAVTDGKEVVSGELISVELPEIAENGNQVQYSIAVAENNGAFPLSATILVTGNPRPSVGTYHFSPLMGQARFTSRLRLGQTQEVVVLADIGEGKIAMHKQTVKVTIGGCGG